jgi:dolichol-phosphate mannosyltransferase
LISVIVPVMNEEGNLASLVSEIASASTRAPITEIIYVDDGSTDNTYDVLKVLMSQFPMLRVLKHDRRCGQSTALLTGIRASTNNVIVTLDGDGQNDPADIPTVYDLYKSETINGTKVMITGRRKKRQDSFARRFASRFANRLRAYLLKDKTPDTGCSLKMFARVDYMNLPFFNHMHRFLPALMVRDGIKLAHVDVSHRARLTGVSKYTNFNRAIVGISDLMGVMWLQRRPNGLPIVSEFKNER